MIRPAFLSSCAFLLTACAANPAAIQPDAISSSMYADYSCPTLEELRVAKQEEIDELSKSQQTKRIVDGVSNVVLLPGLASVIPDSSKPLARSKGELVAMINEYDRRCIRRDLAPGGTVSPAQGVTPPAAEDEAAGREDASD